MLLPNSRLGKFPGEQTHLKCQKYALFTRHCPLDLELDGLRLDASVGDGHEQNVTTERCRSASRNCSDDKKRFRPRHNRMRQRCICRLMRQIFLAREEAQKRPALLRDLVPNRPAQHGIAGLQRIKHRPLRDRRHNFKLHFAANMRQRSQMLWQYDSNHGSVCTSTDSTAGRSRTIGAQLSPASADA